MRATSTEPLRDMAALLHLVAMQPSRAEMGIRVLARCRGPLCSTGPAGDAITAGSCGWIAGPCSPQTNNPNYSPNSQYTRGSGDYCNTLPPLPPSRSLSFHFLLFLRHIWAFFPQFCPLISLTLPQTFFFLVGHSVTPRGGRC